MTPAGDPTARVWLDVHGVVTRTGVSHDEVYEALLSGRANLEAFGRYESGDLRGYQRKARGRWSIHVDDADTWVRGELPAPKQVSA